MPNEMMHTCDFSGWATRNNLKCSDGRTIKKDAFKQNDGKTVPLIWNHQHDDPLSVLGHAVLENQEDGVYAYCYLNDSESGEAARVMIAHHDVNSLSIWANGLRQQNGDVLHGNIREVSLVLAGANPGAYIDSVMIHGEASEEEAIIYNGEDLVLSHADKKDDDEQKEKKPEKKNEDEETVEDVFNTLNEKQKTVVYALIGQALEENDSNKDEGGNESMKHNVFEKNKDTSVLSHADEESILSMAKTSGVGTFQEALRIFAEENNLQHDATSGGFIQTNADGNVTWLFPEYKDLGPAAPELITNDQGWVDIVMKKVHKSPISRIRTRQVDIRKLQDLRAKGYKKGKQKKLTGNIKLARRTTDPQTVYVKNALHRDDIADITDFDYVQYMYNIDRTMLYEELAMAVMLGDGRDDGDEDKISPEHIRPVWLDDDLYTIHVDIELDKTKTELQGTNTAANFGENYIVAESMVNTCLYAREDFRGSGTPTMFITPHMLNVMLLARDLNGRRIYNNVSELATAMNVDRIMTAEQFEGKTRTVTIDGSEHTKKLIALIVNLADYSLGATKGGEVTHFTQFDIDFNQEKSLIETRSSGALTRIYSAIAIEEDVTDSNSEP